MLDADEVPAGALLLAAVSSRNEMMLEDALKRPQKESDMAGAVQVACESGQTSMLRKMLHAGVKPDRHALWAACWSGHAETARVLVETGGVEITDTERHICARHGTQDVLKQIHHRYFYSVPADLRDLYYTSGARPISM